MSNTDTTKIADATNVIGAYSTFEYAPWLTQFHCTPEGDAVIAALVPTVDGSTAWIPTFVDYTLDEFGRPQEFSYMTESRMQHAPIRWSDPTGSLTGIKLLSFPPHWAHRKDESGYSSRFSLLAREHGLVPLSRALPSAASILVTDVSGVEREVVVHPKAVWERDEAHTNREEYWIGKYLPRVLGAWYHLPRDDGSYRAYGAPRRWDEPPTVLSYVFPPRSEEDKVNEAVDWETIFAFDDDDQETGEGTSSE